jgi:hypothetical protein
VIFSPKKHLVTLARRSDDIPAKLAVIDEVGKGLLGLFQYQSDQIGRIFAYWTIVFFGKFFENYTISQQFLATFFSINSNVSISTKYGLGDFSPKLRPPCPELSYCHAWHRQSGPHIPYEGKYSRHEHFLQIPFKGHILYLYSVK